MQSARSRLVVRLAVTPVIAVVVLAGVWITGALVTNDFAVSMGLTAGWIAFSAVTCLAVAVRSRLLRWPMLGGVAAAAAIAAAYLGPAVVGDRVVDERVAAPTQQNVRLRAGRFQPVRHDARGVATVIRLRGGGRVLTLTHFAVANGPDLRVYLAAGRPRTEGDVRDHIDLGGLKGNEGDQQYRIPRGTRLDRYATVVVWCRAFSVLFASAVTEPTPKT
jgi:hypothetical protein